MDRKKETSNISHPWNSKKESATGVRCPACGNDGMDGTITGHSGQFQLVRHCIKPDPETGKVCNRKWSGGIGVQRADFSQEPLVQGGTVQPYSPPDAQDMTPGFRNPSKNRDVGED